MAISQVSLRIFPEVLRSIASGSISGTYMGIGTALLYPARVIMFQNTTDQDVLISWDGIHDHQIIPTNSFTLVDVATNKVNDQGWFAPSGQRFYVKAAGAFPSTGSVYLTTFYGVSEGG